MLNLLPSADEKKFQRILVHAPNWVGDHVMAFPFYLTLQKLFPHSEKILLARAWVKDILPKNVFQNVISLQTKEIPLQTLRQLKNPDIAFTLSPSFRSALLLCLAQAKLRFGYPTPDRFLLLRMKNYKKEIPSYNIYEHRALNYLRLLIPFFSPKNLAHNIGQNAGQSFAQNIFNRFLHLNMTSAVEIKSDAEKKSQFKNLLKKKYWVVAPGSADASKIYPLEYHAQIITQALTSPKNTSQKIETIVLVGSAKEKSQCQEIINMLPKKILPAVVNLSGKTNLSDLFLLMKNSLAVTANDSGVAHMTYLSNSKLLTFLGMAREKETLTLTKQKIVLKKNLPCLGCMKHVCPRTNSINQCLRDIQPQEVIDAMKKILQLV